MDDVLARISRLLLVRALAETQGEKASEELKKFVVTKAILTDQKNIELHEDSACNECLAKPIIGKKVECLHCGPLTAHHFICENCWTEENIQRKHRFHKCVLKEPTRLLPLTGSKTDDESAADELKEFAVSKAISRGESKVQLHRSCTCNECFASPLYGKRFYCHNCSPSNDSFDICEKCWSINSIRSKHSSHNVYARDSNDYIPIKKEIHSLQPESKLQLRQQEAVPSLQPIPIELIPPINPKIIQWDNTNRCGTCNLHLENHSIGCRDGYKALLDWLQGKGKELQNNVQLKSDSTLYSHVGNWFQITWKESQIGTLQLPAKITAIHSVVNPYITKGYLARKELFEKTVECKEFVVFYARNGLKEDEVFSGKYDQIFQPNNKDKPFGNGIYTGLYSFNCFMYNSELTNLDTKEFICVFCMGCFSKMKTISSKNKLDVTDETILESLQEGDIQLPEFVINDDYALKPVFLVRYVIDQRAMMLNPKIVISGSQDNNVKVWVLNTKNCIATLTGHTHEVLCVIAMKDKHKIASGSFDRTIKIWNIKTQECDFTFQGHAESVECLLEFNSQKIISGSADKTVKVWNMETKQCERTFHGFGDTVRCLARLDNERIISGSWDNKFNIWNISNGTHESTVEIDLLSYITSIALLDCTRIICSCDNTLRIWNIENNECTATLDGHTGCIWTVITWSQKLIASGCLDNTIKIWNSETLECEKTIYNDAEVLSIALLDEDCILSGDENGNIKIWNIETGKCVHCWSCAHAGTIWSVGTY